MSPPKCLVLCCVPNCPSSQHTATLFKFPLDIERAKRWATVCGRTDFFNLLNIYGRVPGNYKLCDKHFDKNQYVMGKRKKKILVDDAVPTVFRKYFKKNILQPRPQETITHIGLDTGIASCDSEPVLTRVICVKEEKNGSASSKEQFIIKDEYLDTELSSSIFPNSASVDKLKMTGNMSKAEDHAHIQSNEFACFRKMAVNSHNDSNNRILYQDNFLTIGHGEESSNEICVETKDANSIQKDACPTSNILCSSASTESNHFYNIDDSALRRNNFVNKRGRPRKRLSLGRRDWQTSQQRFAEQCYYCDCLHPAQRCGRPQRPLLFAFPVEIGRCLVWAANCRDQELMDKVCKLGSAFVHKHFRLCPSHFLPQTYLLQYKSLVWNAVPTIFSRSKDPPHRDPFYFPSPPVKTCHDSRCRNHYSASNTRYFSFPSDPLRCSAWVNRCQDLQLLQHFNKFGSDYFSRHMHLCTEHFSPNCFHTSGCLKEDSVPTRFVSSQQDTVPTHSSREASRSAATGSEAAPSCPVQPFVKELPVCGPSLSTKKLTFLREELASLRADSARQRAKLTYFKKKVALSAAQRESSFTADDGIDYIKQRLCPTTFAFFKVQMFSAIKPRWNAKSLEVAILSSGAGKKVYQTLSKIVKLPCHATIRRFRTSKQNFSAASRHTSDIALKFGYPMRDKKSSLVNRKTNALRAPVRKNKTVAQILEEFLGKQSIESEQGTACLPASHLFSSPGLVKSDVSTIVGGESITSSSLGALVCPEDIVHESVDHSNPLVVTNATDDTLPPVTAAASLTKPLGQHVDPLPPVTAASGLTQPLSHHVCLETASSSSFVMNPMRVDGSITYMYDLLS